MPDRNSNGHYVIGVDLGGTKISGGAVSLDGSRTAGLRSIGTQPELGAEGVVDRIIGLIEGVMSDTMQQTGAARSDFVGIGIGAPGPLDRENGIVIVAPNLGWRDFPLRERVMTRIGLPSTLDNDANCATVGEWWLGDRAHELMAFHG